MDFLEIVLQVLTKVNDFVWGPPLLILLVGTGIMLTIRLRLLQVLKLPKAVQLIFKAENKGEGDINSFAALCTALAATVGTGNIVGVATAITSEDLVLYFGCGLQHFLVWLPSMQKGY